MTRTMGVLGGCLLVGLVSAIGCSSAAPDESPDPGEPAVLTRRDKEPPGANCPNGGTAIRTGHDQDGDGRLFDNEVEHTEYVCDPATTVLTRKDPLAPSADCPTGGVAVRTGIDDNRDGVLEDAEIDQTTNVCNPAGLYDGDFTADDWSDPAKVAALTGARVVTGSLDAHGRTAVLPHLELVTGDLSLGDGSELPSLLRVSGGLTVSVIDQPPALPMLVAVDGNAVLVAGLTAIDLPALTAIGGNLSIGGLSGIALDSLHTVHGELLIGGKPDALAAPVLRAIDGPLVIDPDFGLTGALSLPGVETIGGDVRIEGAVTGLALDHATAIGGGIRVEGGFANLGLVLPALQTLGGSIEASSQNLTRIELPALTALGGGLALSGIPQLTHIALPSVTHIAGDIAISQTSALASIELGALLDAGSIAITLSSNLVTLSAPALTAAGNGSVTAIDLEFVGLTRLELPALRGTTGGIRVVNAPALSSVQLPLLGTATSILIDVCPALEAVAAPKLTTTNFIDLSGPLLHALDLGALGTAGIIDIDGVTLADLAGLGALQSVQLLQLKNIHGLADFTSLPLLSHVGNLELENDGDLTSLDGLEAVTQIAGRVSVIGNHALASLGGLRNATHMGLLQLESNPAVTDLALTGLSTIDGELHIVDMDGLTDLAGLDALTSIGGAIEITENDHLPQAVIDAFKARF